jgi:NDP-sugar pyrophosphorylase family protein
VNIVLPMAGKGQRLKGAFKLPKMLIDVCGRPMFYWALDSLKQNFSLDHITFVCLEEHIERYHLDKYIFSYEKSSKIQTVNEVLNGQAESVYAAKSLLNMDESLLIYNCDTYTDFHCSEESWHADLDGVISVFNSRDPSLSYVQIGDSGFISNIIEKKSVSPYASTGLYYFTSTSLFIDTVEKLREKLLPSEEMYIAHVYNALIEKGCKFNIHKAERCYPLGTPHQLENFIQQFHNEDNR